MDVAAYLAATAKTVDVGGYEFRVRKLTIKEHREYEARAKSATTDADWIAIQAPLIAAACLEPKLTTDEIEGCLSVGDMVTLSMAILEHSNPKKS